MLLQVICSLESFPHLSQSKNTLEWFRETWAYNRFSLANDLGHFWHCRAFSLASIWWIFLICFSTSPYICLGNWKSSCKMRSNSGRCPLSFLNYCCENKVLFMYDVRYRDGRNNEADGIQLTFTQEIMRRFVKRVFLKDTNVTNLHQP